VQSAAGRQNSVDVLVVLSSVLLGLNLFAQGKMKICQWIYWKRPDFVEDYLFICNKKTF